MSLDNFNNFSVTFSLHKFSRESSRKTGQKYCTTEFTESTHFTLEAFKPYY